MRTLHDLHYYYNSRAEENQQDTQLTYKRLLSFMRTNVNENFFDNIPDTFVYDDNAELSIKIKYFLSFYTMNKTFVWSAPKLFDQRTILFNNSPVTIHLPRNDIPYETWKRSLLIICYEKYEKEYNHCRILKLNVYGVQIYHNEAQNMYLEWNRFSSTWGVDKKSFLGFHAVQKLVKKKKRSGERKIFSKLHETNTDVYRI